MRRTVTLRDEVGAGLLAGILAGILLDVFLFGEQIAAGAPAAQTIAAAWTQIASVLLGPSALTNPSAPLIGAAVHLAVSVGWALGYVYLARTQPQLLARPWVSGAGFGLVVYVFMQVILITAGQYHRPSPAALGTTLVAHLLFYGIPVALVVARALGRTTARA